MTHIKKYIDSLQDTVGVHYVNFRLQLLEKVWEEYNAVRDQLQFIHLKPSGFTPSQAKPSQSKPSQSSNSVC
jgi:hypothetical protein